MKAADIHQILFDLSADNFEESISHCGKLNTTESIELFSRQALLAIEYRPQKAYLILKFLKQLYSQELNKVLLQQLHPGYLYYCVSIEMFTMNEIESKINQMLDELPPLSQSQERIAAKNYLFKFFSWFGPELSSPTLNSLLHTFALWDSPKMIMQNDWEISKRMRCLASASELSLAIKTDDLKSFIQIMSRSQTSLDSRIEPSDFEPCLFLQHQPTLISLAAFYGSIQIFRFLLLNGAHPRIEDESRMFVHSFLQMNAFHYAIAGGNVEIITMLDEMFPKHYRCGEIASLFHQNDILKWLVEYRGCSPDSIMHWAAAANNVDAIEYCHSITNDANVESEYAQPPLFEAIESNSIDAVAFFLDKLNVDLKKTNRLRQTPLKAAKIQNKQIIQTMLKDKKASLRRSQNSYNNYSYELPHVFVAYA